jgi:uncharacterized integral membrane protein
MSRILFLLALTLAALTGVIVSALNVARVDVELAFVRITTPLGMALVTAFTFGLLAGLLWRVRWMAQLLSERGRLRRELRLAEVRASRASAVVADSEGIKEIALIGPRSNPSKDP